MATLANARGWGAAPASRSSIVTLRRHDGMALPVHKDIAELVRVLCDVTEWRGYNLLPGQCWGYAPRLVRGSKSTWSNHAWGLAVDLNAPSNPMTDNGRLVTNMPKWMSQLWKSYGFRWGGDYPGARKDAMHFEYMGTPASARQHTEDIKAPRPVVRQGVKSEAVALLQRRLNANGAGLKVDGVFGPKTHDVVRWVQGSRGLATDGVAGPDTWNALG